MYHTFIDCIMLPVEIPFQLFATMNGNKINRSLYITQYLQRSQILRNRITGSDFILLGMYCQILAIYLKCGLLN